MTALSLLKPYLSLEKSYQSLTTIGRPPSRRRLVLFVERSTGERWFANITAECAPKPISKGSSRVVAACLAKITDQSYESPARSSTRSENEFKNKKKRQKQGLVSCLLRNFHELRCSTNDGIAIEGAAHCSTSKPLWRDPSNHNVDGLSEVVFCDDPCLNAAYYVKSTARCYPDMKIGLPHRY